MLLWSSNIQEIYAHQCVGMGKGIYYYIILLLSFIFIIIITIIIIVIIIHHYRVDYHVDFPVDTWWLCIFTECRCLPVHWCKAGHHGRSEKGSEFGTIRCSLVDPMNFRQFPWFFSSISNVFCCCVFSWFAVVSNLAIVSIVRSNQTQHCRRCRCRQVSLKYIGCQDDIRRC